MAKLDVALIDTGNDWCALYVNGKSVMQAHKIDIEDVLDYLGIKLEFSRPTVDDEWFERYGEKYGQLPDKLKDVKVVP